MYMCGLWVRVLSRFGLKTGIDVKGQINVGVKLEKG